MNKKLYVTNINYDATEKELHEMFSEVGKVMSAKIINDRDNGRSRGFGFVEMETPLDAEAGLGLSGQEFMGRTIKVVYAREKK